MIWGRHNSILEMDIGEIDDGHVLVCLDRIQCHLIKEKLIKDERKAEQYNQSSGSGPFPMPDLEVIRS